MKKLILALSITSFSASAATAQASFEAVDANANGTVSMAEATDAGLPWSQDQFTLADKDGDGELNPDEFAAAVQ